VLRALSYGTVPVVRATGALDDAVQAFESASGQGTGFKFSAYTRDGLEDSLREAVTLNRRHSEQWRQLISNGMRQDHSWDRAARDYEELYRRFADASRQA
jgi:starch synthase